MYNTTKSKVVLELSSIFEFIPISVFLNILFSIFLISNTHGQTNTNVSCSATEYIFVGNQEQTLCQAYPNFVCAIQIGVGTLYPKSSLLGASISGNVCIVGDFIVDSPFSFENAIVKINPGVKIDVTSSLNGFDQGNTVNINNSKMFACDGLWKGITLGQLSSINMWNNCKIEDAEIVIAANNLCGLSIEQTTFNRNRVGIKLTTTFPNLFISGPIIWNFKGNSFTCNAPLNGTINEISYAGIILDNSYLYNFTNEYNTFRDLKYGIFAIGNYSYIGAQKMRFFNIKNDGIFMEQGNLFLKESYFNNCVGNGINIKKILNVNISDGCNFTWDSNLQFQSPNNTSYYNGINLQGSLVGGSCKISHNYFHANVNSILQEIAGVNFTSYDFSGNSTTNINDNNFKLTTSRYSTAINLRAFGSSNSSFRIIGNFFDLTTNSNSIGRPYGIFSTGKRDNLEVVGNTFYNIPPNFYPPMGIGIQGSDNGNNNFIAENHFTSGLSDLSLYLLSINYCSYYFALEISDCPNTTFCENTFFNVFDPCFFNGNNLGTTFGGNTSYSSELIYVNSGLIDNQDKNGNIWTPYYNNVLLPRYESPQARCASSPSFSEFIVNTSQSTAIYGPGFNQYHPKEISPDVDDEWWSFQAGTTNNCLTQFNNPGKEDTKTKRLIASNDFILFNDSSLNWQIKRSLFFSLKRKPELVSSHTGYSSFISTYSGSVIDKFNSISVALDSVRNGNASIIGQVKHYQSLVDSAITRLEEIDNSYYKAVSNDSITNFKNLKIRGLGELMEYINNLNILQNTYSLRLKSEIPNIRILNNSISPSNKLEYFEKKANSVFINYLENDTITLQEIELLTPIAQTCPENGGMAVYLARVLLPACTLSGINFENCTPSAVAPSIVSIESNQRELKTIEMDSSIKIWPNPTFGLITISNSQNLDGNLTIYNSYGKFIDTKKIIESETTIDLSDLPAGVYYIYICDNFGKKERFKLILIK